MIYLNRIRISSAKLFSLFVILMLSLGANYLLAAWSNPTSNPTGGNVDAPLNTGSTAQVKNGSLSVNDFTAYGTILSAGHVTDSARMELGYGRTGSGYSYLDLVGDTSYSDYGLRLLRGNGGANTWSALYHRGTGSLYLIAQDAGSLRFRTANTDRMTIDATGDIGIGDTTPDGSLKLDVEGQVGATQYCDQNGGNCFTPSSVGGGGGINSCSWIDAGGKIGGGNTLECPSSRPVVSGWRCSLDSTQSRDCYVKCCSLN